MDDGATAFDFSGCGVVYPEELMKLTAVLIPLLLMDPLEPWLPMVND